MSGDASDSRGSKTGDFRGLEELTSDQRANLSYHYSNQPNPNLSQLVEIAENVGVRIFLVCLFYNEQRREHAQQEESKEHVEGQESREHVQEKQKQPNESESSDDEEEEGEPYYRAMNSLSAEELEKLCYYFQQDPEPSENVLRELASKFGLYYWTLNSWYYLRRIEVERKRVVFRIDLLDTATKTAWDDPEPEESTSPKTAKRDLRRHIRPIDRSVTHRTILHLSDDELEKLYAHLSQTPNPTQSDLVGFAEEMRLTVEDIEMFIKMQHSTGTESVPSDRVNSVELSKSCESRENVLESEKPPMFQHWSNLEFGNLIEIFEKNQFPSAEKLRKYAAAFETDVEELKEWFHTKRIEMSHQEVMEKKRAKRKLAENTEKQEAPGSSSNQPSPKRVLAVPKKRRVLDRIIKKAERQAEMFELKIQNQKMKQNHQSYEPPAKLQKTEDSDNSDSVTLNAPAENKDLDETLQTARVVEDTATAVNVNERRGEEPFDENMEQIRQLIADQNELIEQLKSQISKNPSTTEKLEERIKDYSESMIRAKNHLATESEELAKKQIEIQGIQRSLQLFNRRLDTLEQDCKTALAKIEQLEKQLENVEEANTEQKEAFKSVQKASDLWKTETDEENMGKEREEVKEAPKSPPQSDDNGQKKSAEDKDFDDVLWG